MAMSNNTGRLLLNTTNKSEMAMGYGTMYGDLCGALSVISDLTKTQVFALCHYINSISPQIPKNILTKAPTAELKPNQKDTDSLPPYEVLDPFLMDVINNYGRQQLLSGIMNKTKSTQLMQTIARNEYKRKQSAPGLKISSKAFGSGRRIPIVVKLNF